MACATGQKGHLLPKRNQPWACLETLDSVYGPMDNFLGPIWNPWGTQASASNVSQNIIGILRPGVQQPLVKLVAPWITLQPLHGTHGAPKQKGAMLGGNVIDNLKLGLQQPLVKLVAPWITLWALCRAQQAPKHKPAVLARI